MDKMKRARVSQYKCHAYTKSLTPGEDETKAGVRAGSDAKGGEVPYVNVCLRHTEKDPVQAAVRSDANQRERTRTCNQSLPTYTQTQLAVLGSEFYRRYMMRRSGPDRLPHTEGRS